jgi:pimeloyl-ACP methyl ester carboxylesterase
MTTKFIVLASAVIVALPAYAGAQDVAAVFVHGLAADQRTWQATAARLQQQLAIRPYVPGLSWREVIETQASQLQNQFAGLPASTIAIGHSNGGLVAREWSRQHPLRALLTVGTPNKGAPAVDHLHDMVLFNQNLYNVIGLAGGALSIDPSTWNFVYLFVRGAMIFSQQFAVDTVRGAVGLGLQYGIPVLGQMSTGSYLIGQLNSPTNIVREQSTIAGRVGLIYVANNYWLAGPARAIDPDNADRYFVEMLAAISIMEGAAAYLAANYPTNGTANWIANALFNAAGWVRLVDPVWCWVVTSDSSCNTPHDGIVPTANQMLPGAANIEVRGPAHIQEPKESSRLHYVLTQYFGVAPRSGGSVPSGSAGSADELGPGQTLFAGQKRTSGDGRFELVFQEDGNLVLYRVADGVARWATHTYAPGGETVMQGDGNLVVYDASGVARWNSRTASYPGAGLFVQTDGNVVIYDYYGYAIWATGTAQ